jgi:CRP-like cAMP-binding protein
LVLVPDIESRVLGDGTRLLKQVGRAEYMALSPVQAAALEGFAGSATVQEILHDLLAREEHPGIREFYDLVSAGLAKGFLRDCGDGDGAAGSPALVGQRWRVGWGQVPALALALVVGFAGAWFLLRSETEMPITAGGWLMSLALVSLALSVGAVLQGCVLAGFGRQVYRPRLRFDRLLPFFAVDTRDAFMGGRMCQLSVSLQALSAPFLLAVVAGLAHCPIGLFAASVAVLLVTSPFGPTPAHEILHALFRKAYELPRCAATFLGRKVFEQLLKSGSSGNEENYLFTYSVYAVVWVGVLARFIGGLIRRQGSALMEECILAPELSTKLGALLVVLLLVAMLLAPLGYQVWLILRNLYTVLAPRWFRAESRLQRVTVPGQRPAVEHMVGFLRGSLLFAGLGEETLQKIAEAMRFLHLKPRTTVIRQGDAGDALFVVYSGTVAVSKEDETGTETVVARLGVGEVFGEIALLADAPRNASVRTLVETELLQLGRAEFDALLVASVGAWDIATIIQVCAFLKRHELFADWNDQALQSLARDFRSADFVAGEVLIRQDEPNDTFFLIYEGSVLVRKDGKDVSTLGAGGFCGEISLLRGGPAIADMVALSAGRCLRLDKDKFLQVVTEGVHTGVSIEDTLESRLAQ